jgi:hypothetical protein
MSHAALQTLTVCDICNKLKCENEMRTHIYNMCVECGLSLGIGVNTKGQCMMCSLCMEISFIDFSTNIDHAMCNACILKLGVPEQKSDVPPRALGMCEYSVPRLLATATPTRPRDINEEVQIAPLSDKLYANF